MNEVLGVGIPEDVVVQEQLDLLGQLRVSGALDVKWLA